jgi:putative phosphoesterase
MSRPTVIGLISDTHGLLRPQALAALAGCDLILHAGDIGGPDILRELSRLAPLTTVRGNVDEGEWADALPQREIVERGGVKIYLVHDIADLDVDPVAAGIQVVVSGHSHLPRSFEKDGVLFANPGGAGPRRFNLPVTVGRLTVADGRAGYELIRLDCPKD